MVELNAERLSIASEPNYQAQDFLDIMGGMTGPVHTQHARKPSTFKRGAAYQTE